MIRDLTKGNPARVIFIYSLPIIIGNVFQQVYNFVDNVIVGRYVSYQALAGVGVTNGMTYLMLGFMVGITGGLGVKTAQHFGSGDIANVRKSIATGIVVCSAFAAVMTAASVLLADPVLRLLGAGPDIFGYARDYSVIIFAGLATQAAYNFISSVLRALGDSRTPLYFLIFSSVLNVVLDFLFVCGTGWGVRGAAFATVLSQLLSAVLCFIYAFTRYKEIRLRRSDFKLDGKFISDHLSLSFPMAVQSSIIAVGVIFLNAALASFPSQYIAGFSAASRTSNLGALVPVSLGVAMANYAGQNYGAGMMKRIRQGVRACCLMAMGVCLPVSSAMLVFPEQLTSLFVDPDTAGDVADIYDASVRYLRVSASLFPFLFLIFIFRNALLGIGRPFWPFMACVGELVLRAVTSFIFPKMFGYTGVIYVDCLSWVVACLIVFLAYVFIVVRKGAEV